MFKFICGLLLFSVIFNPFQLLCANQTNWEPYLEDSKNEVEPGIALVKAMEKWSKENPGQVGFAVDLGAGTGRDTLYLLKKGWHVLAIDLEEKAIEIIKSRLSEEEASRLSTQVASFEEMELPSVCDIINARNALSYCDPDAFPNVWEKIVNCIAPGGCFSGTFFGDRAIPISIPHAFSLNREELLHLFREHFDIIFFDEQDRKGQGWRWHMFYITAQK